MGSKVCTTCNKEKDITLFDKKASRCKSCRSEYDKKRRGTKNSERTALVNKNKELKRLNKRYCKTCETIKTLSCFTGYKKKKDNSQQYVTSCKDCELKKQREYRRKNIAIIEAQRERSKPNKAKWYHKDKAIFPEKYKERSKSTYEKADKEKLTAKRIAYYSIEENREKRRKRTLLYQNERYGKDQHFKIRICLAQRIRQALKHQGTYKSCNTMDYVGCSKEELKTFIENQFTDGMTWENYGLFGWHIDHIKPCASFDLTDPEQQKECFHYTNLQPLWAEDNLRKSDKLNWTKED